MVHDVRVSIRQLLKRPGWAAAIILVLAVGIGANTAMFSGFEAWVLRPLDLEDPERLVVLKETQPRLGRDRISVSARNLGDWVERQGSFEAIAAYQSLEMNLNDETEPVRLIGTRMSASLLKVLGRLPALGRNFTDSEDLPRQPAPVAIVSYRLWQERFGGAPDIIGQTIRIDNVAREIIGVMEPHFAFPEWSDVFVPLALDTKSGPRPLRWVSVVARLRDGVSLEAADAEIAAIADDLAAEFPEENRGYSATAFSLRRDFVPPVIEVALTASLASAFFVLFVICANVASLVLAQAAARSRETAVRAALGASRFRLARQNVIEGVLLAVPAGILGAYIGAVGIRAMLAYVPVDPPYLFRMGFSAEAGVYTLIVSATAGVLCGLAPVMRSSGMRLFDALKSGGREGGGREATRFRSVLVVSELALSTALLIAALLMVRSLVALQARDPGFRTEGIVTAELSLRGLGDDESSAQVAVSERVLSTLRAKVGVDVVGIASHLPGQGFRVWGLVPEDRETADGEDVNATVHGILGDYFAAMEVRVTDGREFTDLEDRAGGDVAIVSEGLAEALWPGKSAIGRRLGLAHWDDRWLTVVGVAGDIDAGRDMVTTDVPDVQLYIPYGQSPTTQVNVVARGRGHYSDLAAAMRDSFRAAAPGVPYSEILTMEDSMFRARWVTNFFSRQLTIYAVLAMAIAAIGIYGLTADSVARRTRELAIRLALGAERGALVRLILRDALLLGSLGVGAGLVLSLGITGLASSMFAGVDPRDPTLFALVGLSAFVVIVVAAALPARRASALDPITALRME